MEAFLSLLNEAVVIKFALLLARILSFVAFMPVYGHTSVSPRVRVTFAFLLLFFISNC